MSFADLEIASRVIARTEHWIAIDKPAGLPSRPSPGHGTDALTLLERWLAADGVRPGVVHRLDAGTSGVILFSLSPSGHRALERAFRERRMKKEYLAIVRGAPRPRRGCIDLALARTRSGKVAVTSRGAPAVTRYETLARSIRASWLRVEPVTGRMHQIRVHLAARGVPILGDPLYAPREPGAAAAPRLCLHAHRLTLDRPLRIELGEDTRDGASGPVIEAEEPPELRAVRAELGLGL